MTDYYSLIKETPMMYSTIIDDRIYFSEGEYLILNPIYNEVESVMEFFDIPPDEIDSGELEAIIMGKLNK